MLVSESTLVELPTRSRRGADQFALECIGSITRDGLAGPSLPILDPERPLSREAASIFEEPIASGKVDELATNARRMDSKPVSNFPPKIT